MVVWKRGPPSRRLTLVFWFIFLVAVFRYRAAFSELLYPTPKPAFPGPGGASVDKGIGGTKAPAKVGVTADVGVTPKARPGAATDTDDSTKYFVKSRFDWSKLYRQYPIPESDIKHPPNGPPKALKRVQHAFHRTAYTLNEKQVAQREAVRNAFKRCWDSYVKYGFPHDELTPVTLEGKDTFGGWAATAIDALDTLLIMGLHDEFEAVLPVIGAMDWSKTSLKSINVFETTIRYLGGLLSAYDLSGKKVLLMKAVELGEMLYAAFDTPNNMPPFWLNFVDAKMGSQRAEMWEPSASPCSLSLEFTRLSQLTGEPKYYDAIDRVKRFLERTQSDTLLPGMWPTHIDFLAGIVNKSTEFSVGAEADSLYEYLPKMAALLGGRDPAYEAMYRTAAATAERHLLFRPMLPDGNDVLFAGNAYVHSPDNVQLVADSQHLACFAGGMFGLGGKMFDIPADVATAERLTRGCAWAYGSFPTGLMPEVFGLLPCPSRDAGKAADVGCEWDEKRWAAEGNQDGRLPKGFRHARDPRYILRPEAIESVFLMYRMTGKPEYQTMAWRMFLAIESATATEVANSAIADVTVAHDKINKLDSMESFWMAETLKYFYLVFSAPDVISLDEYVFNTEAHPFKRPDR